MKYYIDPVANKVYAYELDGSQDELIAEGMVAMTPDQVAAHINPPKDPKQVALLQIRALEAQYADAQARVTRQSLLALALERATQDPAAAGLSSEQVHSFLVTQDNGYAALYTLEQQVEALRAQIA